MIEEAYVSYETARLLKEKGFDETCYACYEYFSSGVTMYSGWPFEYKGEVVQNSKDRVKCPTQQMAMRWLREEKNIHINVYTFNRELPISENTSYTVDVATEKDSPMRGHLRGVWETYEEACEAACVYCLKNLI